MYENLKRKKIKDNNGLGTLEIVLIIAVLVAVALIFRKELTSFANFNTKGV